MPSERPEELTLIAKTNGENRKTRAPGERLQNKYLLLDLYLSGVQS